MENSSGSEIFMVIIRIMMDSEILRISSTSSTLGCSGITRNRTMTTTIRMAAKKQKRTPMREAMARGAVEKAVMPSME